MHHPRPKGSFVGRSLFNPATSRCMLRAAVMCLTASVASLAMAQPQDLSADRERAERPNFVWIMSEDNSKHYLRHFDADGVAAPHIEAMAQQGITFERAFSCSPVCSVARTTLITACYAPRVGTQFHRKLKVAPLPEGLAMFPAYLRRAGYFTTNRSKEDYNAAKTSADDPLGPWDLSRNDATWKRRPNPSMPFFHVVTFADSHESRMHVELNQDSNRSETDPAGIRLQPYFPDTPLFRQTRARYHDRIAVIDGLVRGVIDELREAGELENTFVFYFGDHGGVLPRSKGYLYESGLHVPLVVRVPGRFRERTQRDLGSRSQGFVEFVDFGPTVLALAGITPPKGIDGRAFLGSEVDPAEVDARNEAFGYADRFDERYELVRSLRQGRWKYIRNFEAFVPDSLQNNYRYLMPAYQQWREQYRAGALDDVRSQFFRPKHVEALYDLQVDPHEIVNLAENPSHRETLLRLRNRLEERLKAMPDLSFFPETVLHDEALKNPVVFGQSQMQRISKLIDTAQLSLQPFDDVAEPLRGALENDDDPWQRYWGLIACSCFGDQAAALTDRVRACLSDDQQLVAARAAECLAIVAGVDPRPVFYRTLSQATDEAEALQILNMAVVAGEISGGKYLIDPQRIRFGFQFGRQSEIVDRLQYLATLSQVE